MPPKAPSNLRPVQNPKVNAVRPPPAPRPAPRPVNPAEIRKTKEYKVAARRWLSTIVALPIVMYTSWILYERVYGNKSPRRLIPQQPSQQDSSSSTSSSSTSS
ncbi:uncharacterized protein N7473_007849 [Penicillium subrubescens]|uniref:uncharacterized protein n=1 Tax=Penicillium subrubescens TaxID=1316194 RepID=UPI002545BC26|nr:uncharacterized protein N7473_007849 [Penicillium subrubescens]KAJ5891621.1 hypothetical protein N7473_007849 [Penicillium subrubescens]